ncbi:chemotaxis protein CheD [Methylomagnum ishizawai]|uniref:Probable chemoreceptor glutamine deamidase CheD n=1 Tax=Methylomagnum ishizawai TaxID=1760988 RepID=A0A1Y6D3Z7_9GAMM|nr:chemotaxis protein CheD [Methylomagnum ishizawai]SMF95114.1 chemotaxis protein CheD [Methylomagnum ishizawai]
MHPPSDLIEIFLQPGEFYFGGENTRIRTLLGSCIAITFWHPQARFGGMCHFLLPRRPDPAPRGHLDGRYGDEALLWLIREAVAHHTDPGKYEVKVFGGGNMFPGSSASGRGEVGLRNIERAFRLLGAYGLPVAAKHVGGHGHRNLIFDVWSGHVWLKFVRTDGQGPG